MNQNPNNLILIGYRATGKSTLAALLAEKLGWDAIDSDVLIEQKAGKSIARIFAEDGEPAFRDLESDVIAEVLCSSRLEIPEAEHGSPVSQGGCARPKAAAHTGCGMQKNRIVLATGGGVPVRPANRELLRKHGFVVWLKALPETILARMSSDPTTGERRPNLTNLPPLGEIEHVLQTREPFYRETAHLEIDTEGRTLPEIAADLFMFNFGT